MARTFNIAGPCRPDLHYMIPAKRRLPQAWGLVEEGAYFVVHAPRQTGKTTALRALAADLTASGKYAALHFTCEVGEVAGDDYGAAENMVLSSLARSASELPPELHAPRWPDAPAGERIAIALTAWTRACPRPLVLLFDEIDALQGKSLLSVLRQLRAGYNGRPTSFPTSVVLCGLRDVRDYKAASGGDPSRLGSSSPFNIKLASLRVGDFTESDLRELYGQHTAETGQTFTEEALTLAWEVTQGQPWLVNALARKIVRDMAVPAHEAITAAHVDQAKELLILERATHLDSLVDKLQQPRVQRVMEPIVAGLAINRNKSDDLTYDDDIAYVRDLGLIAPRHPVQIANPIYKEVIVRVLGSRVGDHMHEEPRAYRLPDGRFAWKRALRSFARFWREHGEMLASRVPYPEAGPQLVLMAYLQALVNGGGYIDREYGIGSGRIDLLMRHPYEKPDGTRAVQRRAMEIKVWRRGRANPLKHGLTQLDDYLVRLGLSRGTLVIFDARAEDSAPERAASGKDRGGKRNVRVRFEDAKTSSGRRARVIWA